MIEEVINRNKVRESRLKEWIKGICCCFTGRKKYYEEESNEDKKKEVSIMKDKIKEKREKRKQKYK